MTVKEQCQAIVQAIRDKLSKDELAIYEYMMDIAIKNTELFGENESQIVMSLEEFNKATGNNWLRATYFHAIKGIFDRRFVWENEDRKTFFKVITEWTKDKLDNHYISFHHPIVVYEKKAREVE